MRTIAGFEQDEMGDWVARLACGHSQHVRHKPPLESRPWVLTPAGRRERVGHELPCRYCLMPVLPPDLKVYKTTPWFDGESIPPGLTRSHRLKADVWGRIVVEAGYLLYTIEQEPPLVFVLSPRVSGVVQPERPHHVAPRGAVRFRVEFLRRAEPSAREGGGTGLGARSGGIQQRRADRHGNEIGPAHS